MVLTFSHRHQGAYIKKNINLMRIRKHQGYILKYSIPYKPNDFPQVKFVYTTEKVKQQFLYRVNVKNYPFGKLSDFCRKHLVEKFICCKILLAVKTTFKPTKYLPKVPPQMRKIKNDCLFVMKVYFLFSFWLKKCCSGWKKFSCFFFLWFFVGFRYLCM